jgi:hypothetical protein
MKIKVACSYYACGILLVRIVYSDDVLPRMRIEFYMRRTDKGLLVRQVSKEFLKAVQTDLVYLCVLNAMHSCTDKI